MQKLLKNKRRLVRPTDALLPIGFAVGALIGGEGLAVELFFALLATRLLALASATGARAAFAERPSLRGVRETARQALALQILGGLLALALWALCPAGWRAALDPWLILAGALLNIEHVFYEYMFAVNQGDSAALSRFITSALTAAGIAMSRGAASGALSAALSGSGATASPAGSPVWPCVAAAVGAVASGVTGILIGGPLKDGRRQPGGTGRERLAAVLERFRRSPLTRRAPAAMAQAALYPIVGLLALRFRPFGDALFPLFAGWAVYALCRAPFRRSPSESRVMNRALVIGGAALAVVLFACSLPLPNPALRADAALTAYMCLVGGLCGFALYGNVERRE